MRKDFSFFVRPDQDPYKMVSWKKFLGIEAPQDWSETAIEMVKSKYLRQFSPQKSEKSIAALIDRVSSAIVRSGRAQGGYFKNKVSAKSFQNELVAILLSQRGSFNSPVWFNVGLFEKYKIKGAGEQWAWNFKKSCIDINTNPFVRPQSSACFIQKIEDSIEGIFELAKREARLFKYGSGSGTNFSNLRSKFEDLQLGGRSSGLISFLEVLDKGAGAIKSGGTTRRAAKMVCVDIDHPEIREFINWKNNEEKKAKALIEAGYSGGMDGEAYRSVSGQNANNSVRITDSFMRALDKKQIWKLNARTNKKVLQKVKAADLWEDILDCSWSCADPGIQFHDTINKWHTCATSGPIRASNPCSEFMFLDNSACNLASINLLKFLTDSGEFLINDFLHTIEILFRVQDILIDYSSYPSKEIAQNSHDFRPLGLGIANFGAFLMCLGVSYESSEAHTWISLICSLLSAKAYQVSVDMAKSKGSFAKFKLNKNSVLKVLKKHARANTKLANFGSEFSSHSHFSFVKLKAKAKELWQEVLLGASQYGVRNAQATLIAPTGTIGLMMDCDTLGIEPDFSLIKIKRLHGGGELVIPNQSVDRALRFLGYPLNQRNKIRAHLQKYGNLDDCSELSKEHQAIFICAVSTKGGRVISPEAHIRILAAAQPFLSGAISKTVNLPESATKKDIDLIYRLAWALGVKAVTVYRENSKLSQPLVSSCGLGIPC